ncbi:hypothetical protein [Streptomyces macrosporus]|uniref:Uncharacterized protein n=1 Tax=Streptomyces macrosporus TaxID=44032 RepID=A0ABN3K946_9ACTN
MAEELPGTNEGIVISGNARVSNAAMAAGRGASAVHHSDGAAALETVLAALADLRERLDTGRADAADLTEEERRAARAEADVLAEELAADEPRPGRITACLERLRLYVGDAASLVGLVTGIQEGVRAITGG